MFDVIQRGISSIFGGSDEQSQPQAEAQPETRAAGLSGLFGKADEVLTAKTGIKAGANQIFNDLAAQKKAEEAQRLEAEAQADPLFKTDPKAARELVDARNDMKGMFEVVDPKKVAEKDRKQNQLTEAEMRTVLDLYAAIKAGRKDLDVTASGGTADENADMKSKQLHDLARIMQTKSGRELVTTLADNKDDKGKHLKTHINASSSGFPQTTREGGKGHDVNIAMQAGKLNYIPGMSSNDNVGWANVVRPDVALYHEMVHAYHKHKGDDATWVMPENDPKKTGNRIVHPFDKGVEADEYQAVGLGPWAPGGKYEKTFNAAGGKGWGGAQFTENKYRLERNEITTGGQFNDFEPNEAMKAKIPDWQNWWKDGQMKVRDRYNPEANIKQD